jgi:hypothetical protein
MTSGLRPNMQGTPQGGIGVDGGAGGVVKKTKLRGRAFYESIGSPKLVLAPMVEQSEFVRLSQTLGRYFQS